MKWSQRAPLFLSHALYHYESALFGWMTPYLAPLFFPNKSGVEALLYTFALLPLSFLAKPIGAIVWGLCGDRFGRKPVLFITLSGMTLSTFAIGCIPLMPDAWILLVLCRLLQGFFSTGQTTGAALLLMENAPPEKRSWLSSQYDACGIGGIALASFATVAFGHTYWRFLFWLAAAFSLIALLLGRKTRETVSISQEKLSWKIFWNEKRRFFQILCVAGFSYGNYYLISIFLNGLLPQITSLSQSEVLGINSCLLVLDAPLLLFFGWACRYIPRNTIMFTAALCAAFVIYPLFSLLPQAGFWTVAWIRFLFILFGVALAAPFHAWKVELLSRHRFLLGGLGGTLGAKFFGAPIPFVATWIFSKTGSIGIAAFPLMLLALFASLALLPLPFKAKKPSMEQTKIPKRKRALPLGSK